ncbi:conserved hypothetical protein [Phenylobacterium zucineum HLK1]|uniref:Secreted protein n=1 Tax=Phenylobacterium zucineum (strain HLK1) TaxID=450851 RepID=B4R9A0_PHEZH|nr:hypothetical protein [Phenylobacterium zucineum]ACG77770.1 conserved hypothetical protein [Phenylobacterium zucineum HLK1]
MRPVCYALAAAVLGLGLTAPAGAAEPHDAFFAALKAMCGKSYTGRMASDDPADTAFRAPVTLRVRDCTADTVRMPVQVGEDRSRTWVVTRAPEGLTLKHDHRHADGSEDTVSRYGGTTTAAGTARRQDFPADAFSRELFQREGIPASMANVWSMEIEPGRTFAYELNRPGRHFRLEFDLTAGK